MTKEKSVKTAAPRKPKRPTLTLADLVTIEKVVKLSLGAAKAKEVIRFLGHATSATPPPAFPKSGDAIRGTISPQPKTQ